MYSVAVSLLEETIADITLMKCFSRMIKTLEKPFSKEQWFFSEATTDVANVAQSVEQTHGWQWRAWRLLAIKHVDVLSWQSRPAIPPLHPPRLSPLKGLQRELLLTNKHYRPPSRPRPDHRNTQRLCARAWIDSCGSLASEEADVYPSEWRPSFTDSPPSGCSDTL